MTCQPSTCLHGETNTAFQAAPRGLAPWEPPLPLLPGWRLGTWCSLRVAEGTMGPSRGLARQVLGGLAEA